MHETSTNITGKTEEQKKVTLELDYISNYKSQRHVQLKDVEVNGGKS